MTKGTADHIHFEAAATDRGAPVVYRYNPATRHLRIAFDADHPVEAAAALTTLFAHLHSTGTLPDLTPRNDHIPAGR